MKKKSDDAMKRESERGGACDVHACCAVGKWWHGKSGDITLSPNRVIERGKEEGAVLSRNILRQMPSLICPVVIMHHVFAGFTGSFRERSVRHPESAELVIAGAQVARM